MAPHAVAAPGNDYNFRVHVRHGITTRTLAESEIAQRYRDRFQAASDDVDRLHQVADAGFGYLSAYLSNTAHDGSRRATYFPGWVTLAAVPAVRGTYPLTTQADRNAAFGRFFTFAGGGVTTRVQPDRPALVGRRQVRFEGDPTGQLHGRRLLRSIAHQPPERPGRLRRPQAAVPARTRLDLVALVQAAAAWAAETGAVGDLMLSAALHRLDGSDDPVRLVVSESVFQYGPVMPLPATPAQTTGDLAAIVTDKREAVVVACALVSDLLADMGAHQPHVLTSEGDILTDRFNDGFRHQLTGWDV